MILTADLVARAVVAAAVSYGDDPVRACVAKSGVLRRALAPAAQGLTWAAKVPLGRACLILAVSPNSIAAARRAGGDRFDKAAASASEAVGYAIRSADLRDRLSRPPRAAQPVAKVVRPPAARSPAEQPKVALQQNPKSAPTSQRRAPAVETARAPKPTRPPAGRQIARGARFENLGEGVSVIRLKPISEAVVARARQQLKFGLKLSDFADLWDVDVEQLARALKAEVAK